VKQFVRFSKNPGAGRVSVEKNLSKKDKGIAIAAIFPRLFIDIH
jgi:hypothetical protein